MSGRVLQGVPLPRDWLSGDPVTADRMNGSFRDPLNYLLNPPLTVLRCSVTQAIPNNAWTAVLFDTEDIDRLAAHSTTTNTSRMTLPTGQGPGTFEVIACVGFAAAAGGTVRNIEARLNGNNDVLTYAPWQSNGNLGAGVSYPAVRAHIVLNPGDYLEVFAYQNSGANLNTNSPYFSLRRIAL